MIADKNQTKILQLDGKPFFGMAETFRPDLPISGRDEKFSAIAQMPMTYLSYWTVATGQMRINFCHGDADFQKLFCFLFDRADPL